MSLITDKPAAARVVRSVRERARARVSTTDRPAAASDFACAYLCVRCNKFVGLSQWCKFVGFE